MVQWCSAKGCCTCPLQQKYGPVIQCLARGEQAISHLVNNNSVYSLYSSVFCSSAFTAYRQKLRKSQEIWSLIIHTQNIYNSITNCFTYCSLKYCSVPSTWVFITYFPVMVSLWSLTLHYPLSRKISLWIKSSLHFFKAYDPHDSQGPAVLSF